MFRKFTRLIVASMALMALLAGTSFAFEEGKDFMVLEKAIPNAQGTLIKVWSYSCPFCYKYDKVVTQPTVDKLPKSIAFKPYHLSSKGDYGKEGTRLFAVLLANDVKKGLSDRDINDKNKSTFKKVKMAYYNAYHDKKERWGAGANPEAFLQLGLDAAGLSKAEFEKRLQDADVQAYIKEWDAQAYDVAKIQGFPASSSTAST